VSELREQLQRLAQRGIARGADDVLQSAMSDAVRDGARVESNGARDATPLAVMSDEDDAPVVGLHDRRRNRSPWRNAVAVAGIAALVGVTMVAVTAIGDRGGSSSPDGAVRELAKAIDAEDPLAAVDVLAPDEVRSMRATVDAAQRKAADVKLVEQASAPFSGLDLRVDDLTLATEQLADGYVKVHLTGGTISAKTNPSEFSRSLQHVTRNGGAASASSDLATVRPFDTDPFVVAIRRDGNWYVSAAYTALEYVRAVNDLPAADYGSALAANLGADSPQAAAREFVTALGSEQWDTVFALLPPAEIPAYDYRAGLAELFNRQDFGFTVKVLDATAETHGDTATVSVAASGTYPTSDGQGSWDLADKCVRVTYPYEDGPDVPYGFCLADRGIFPFDIFDAAPREGSRLQVQAVQRDGRWFISPVATGLQVLDAWVGNFDQRTLYSVTRDYGALPADGTLALGRELAVSPAGFGLAYAYEFDGVANQRVVGQSTSRGRAFGASGGIYGPDGNEIPNSWGVVAGQVVRLPATGRYRLVILPYRDDVHVTLWDAKDAPKGVAQPGDFESCTTEPGGGTTCSDSSSASSPPTPQATIDVPQHAEGQTAATTGVATQP
jgi:hypothetical protein